LIIFRPNYFLLQWQYQFYFLI